MQVNKSDPHLVHFVMLEHSHNACSVVCIFLACSAAGEVLSSVASMYTSLVLCSILSLGHEAVG